MTAAADVQMIADRWMLESRRLVNWGTYEGYHEFRPSTDGTLPVTLLAGASESGKSTLVDAQTSLLYPTGTPFNKASNSGRSERSDYTYLRGMTGVGNTDAGDEPLYLRGRGADGSPQPVWGAIVDTYRNRTTGQVLSCGKFLYLLAGDGRGEVRRYYVTWGDPMDPRLMDRYRQAPFTPVQLKAMYPGCETFPSADAFHTHIWSVMGLSEAACRLLHRIQSADAPSRLDDIFKQGVLGVPEALGLARATVEDYERYDGNFRAMESKIRRMKALRAISDDYTAYEAACGRMRAFAAADPASDEGMAAIRDRALARMKAEVAAQLPADEQEARARADDAADAQRRAEALRSRLDAISRRMQGVDGGDLARAEAGLDQARRRLEDVTAAHDRIARRFEALGETTPDGEQAWNGRRLAAVNFKRGYDRRLEELDDSRDQAVAARAEAADRLRRLKTDYERQRSQRTRITRRMDEARAMLCHATGLEPSELPYVAELMDVREEDEHWRLAMNAVYGSIARTILVDKRHEQGFAAKVSAIDPRTMPRRTWRFVDTTRTDRGPADASREGRHDGTWLSDRLRFREDSPFADWLRERTADRNLDALCVDAIDDTDRERRQVQADGQIKSGGRGQHGVKDGDEIIGFVNETYLGDLERRIAEAGHDLEQATDDVDSARRQTDMLRGKHELADLLAYTTWEDVDVEGARHAVADLEAAVGATGDDPEMKRLAERRDALAGELETIEERRLEAKQAASSAARAAAAAARWLERHGDALPRGERDPGALADDIASVLDESYDNRFAGIGDAALRAHMIIGAGFESTGMSGESFPDRIIAGMAKDMAARIAGLRGDVGAARAAVEAKMTTYIDMYGSQGGSLAASVDDHRYYLDELEGLSQLVAVETTDDEYRRCLEHLAMSMMTIKRAIDTDTADIHDQLDRINAMLEGQEFGPRRGSLSIHADIRRADPEFRTKLAHVIDVLKTWRACAANGGGDGELARRTFDDCAPMIAMLRDDLEKVKDANGVRSIGAHNLDPRCRSTFYAVVRHDDGPDERITSTGGRSGGALQELTSFVYGAALIYLLGGGMTSEPCYTTLFLDEALIKADGRYTQRALMVLPRLGFQVIVSAPESKTGEMLAVCTKAYVTYRNPDTGLSSLREAVLEGR